MSNMEGVFVNIKPIMVNLCIVIGIIMTVIGITVTLYGFYKKKWTVPNALKYFLSTTVLGLLVSTAGILISFISDFDINTELYQYVIPSGYILSLCILGFLVSKRQQKRRWYRCLDQRKMGDIWIYISTEPYMRNLNSSAKALDKLRRLLLREPCECIWILWKRIQSRLWKKDSVYMDFNYYSFFLRGEEHKNDDSLCGKIPPTIGEVQLN